MILSAQKLSEVHNYSEHRLFSFVQDYECSYDELQGQEFLRDYSDKSDDF